MTTKSLLWFFGTALLILTLSCGEEETKPEPSIEQVQQASARDFEPGTILPDSVAAYEIVRTSALAPMLSDAPDSSLGEQAERYRVYDLVGLTRSTYTIRSMKAEVELARFGTVDDAFGFYASSRPETISAQRLGTEGYSLGPVTNFTQGTYVVSITMEEDDFLHMGAQTLLAREIENRLPEKPLVPRFFMLFPYNYKVVPSTQYTPRSFADIESIDHVYTQRYSPADDTLVFFLTMDTTGTKLLALTEYAQSVGSLKALPDSVFFDGNHGVMFELPGRGTVVAGLIRSKLAGVIGYGE
jgi:hypothetical protein